MNLLDLFDSLETPMNLPTEPIRFSVAPIPDHRQHRLGKDSQGNPVLLISVADNIYHPQPTPFVLQHLEVQHGQDCRVFHPDGTTEQSRFTVVRCTGKDRVLWTYFLHVVNTILISLLTSPSSQEVTEAVARLVELFHVMSELPRKSVQGLWAELFCIAQARDPLVMLRAWHLSPNDIYDFSAGNQRIEVKSASGSIRQHHFALAQLNPPPGTMVLIASLFVERAGGGACVADLAEQIHTRVAEDPKSQLYLDRMIGLTLGSNWRSAIEDRFDRELARHSLAFYDATIVPSVNSELPPGVSDVHFKANLTNCPKSDLQRSKGGLFQAALKL